ncbi:uncharacterized protein LOC114849161 isoform X2 [Betta splendens]|uniref:Uncharacterized protein LOC114849161 isoform X2 n=1 Tax=Betta splendens TaxID=158456 RepID=A0A9W2XL71_BETSP|nr:uncharacterized protein LOC114849161 isoform X2 [Betta splendens]
MTEEDNSLQRERVLTLPSPVKRRRTHRIVTNEYSEENIFDFPEFLTFENTTKFPSSKSILQKNLIVICTADNDDMQEESFIQLQDIKLIVTPRVATSVTDDASRLLPKVCVITAERHLANPGKDLLTRRDKPFSYLPNEAGNALVESYISTDISSSSDAVCHWLGKSQALDFTQNGKDWREAQCSVTKMQAFTLTCDEEIICQSDCSRGNVVCDTVNTLRQSDGAEVSTQKWDQHIFSESSLIGTEGQVGNGSRSCSHYADFEINHLYPKKDHTNEEQLIQSQICKSDRFTICDEETKSQVNKKKSMGKNPFISPADISVFPHDVVLGRNTTTENVSFEIDDLCGVKEEYDADKMKAWNEIDDHTTEAPESEKISQELAEEDNTVGLYSVIDPAIWNEPDREAEERQCNSASTPGVELSPSVEVCVMKMPPPLCFDVRTSQEVSAPNQIRQFYHQSVTLQSKDEKEDLCQSHKEPSITSSEPYNMTGNQSSSPCHPTAPPPAGEGRQESHSVVELQLKEEDQFDSFPNNLDSIRTQEAEQSQGEVSRTAWITMIKEGKNLSSFEEIKTDPHMDLEKVESEEELLHRHELQNEDGACNELKCVKDRLEEKFQVFVDHPYSAHVFQRVETTVEKKRKKVNDVAEGLKSADCENAEGVQQQNEHKTDRMEVKCVDKQTESNRSDNKLKVVNQHRKENKLSFCPDYRHRLETYMLKNTQDLVDFASPSTSDAVVPCQKEPSPSLNANSPTALNRRGRFSPVASACIRYNWVPGEVDIFEKIQLSPDDYVDNDAGRGIMSVLTGFPGQLLKSPQQQPSYSTQEPEGNHQSPEEQEREEEELQQDCHTEYMANGLLNSDAGFNDTNFISAALGQPEQQPNCESTGDSLEPIMVDSATQLKSSTGSTESDSPASDMKQYPEFEMKKQFNVVLKELNLFFDISKSDLASDRTSVQCYVGEPLKTDSSDFKDVLSSIDMGCHKNPSTDNADEDHSMEMCGGDPVISCKAGDDEQEVPLGSHMKHETCQDTAEKQGGPLEQAKRLEPLRTCSRPIRVGLSKRAKTKHLHRPHPYN